MQWPGRPAGRPEEQAAEPGHPNDISGRIRSIMQMFTLAHFTDVHLPLAGARPRELFSKRIIGWLSWNLRRRGRHDRAALDALVADMLAARPEMLALTGDVVNISTRAEFAAARRWLAGLAGPERLVFVPGNHDHYVAEAPAAGLNDLAPWMAGDGEGPGGAEGQGGLAASFPFLRRAGDVALIGVNSAFAAPWRESSGRFDAGQGRRLERLLAAAGEEGLCRIVLIHHPPLAELATARRKALKGARHLRRILEEHGAEAVLYGHNHTWAHHQLETRHGTAHLLAAPSASMRAGEEKPPAGWQMLRPFREGGRWNMEVVRRGLRTDGEGAALAELERLHLAC